MSPDGKKALFSGLLPRIAGACSRPEPAGARLGSVCALLRDSVPWYDWVGFYVMDGAGRELVLGPFSGEPTEHVRIPVGRGICGQAAARGETCLANDVSLEKNYLSCSARVKSEIVVPVYRDGRIVGEIDVDSHSAAPFGVEDRAFLEEVADIAAGLL